MCIKWLNKNFHSVLLCIIPLIGCGHSVPLTDSYRSNRNINFNENWTFYRCPDKANESSLFKDIDFNDSNWDRVTLPHTPIIEPLVVNNQWQGTCWYRKNFKIDKSFKDKKIFIEFEGAMQIADVWMNGSHRVTHYGGYLPFTIDITDDVLFDKENVLAVKLDNHDNPEVPPGKPHKTLDFCMYGGLYRNVNLHITDKLHITDAVYANKTAGGGIFVQYPKVTEKEAQIWVQTHIVNEYPQGRTVNMLTQLFDNKNNLIIEKKTEDIILDRLQERYVEQNLIVTNPALWHPNSPNLYRLCLKIYSSNQIVDEISTDIGIRKISFSASEGFKINGKIFYVIGTNRHQEYPYIGYAISDNANYRDALEIKKAGFDFVRLSHYPHTVSFLDACDKLGLLVLDAIPGWQHFGNGTFQKRSYQDCRDMIRRDRNHPSVIAWEVSLNETAMSEEFMEKCHVIAHEEYPGDQCFTAGWKDFAYDIFIPARQHARPPDYWDTYKKNKPFFIAEYGDWEYYAQNAGFNQEEFKNLSPEGRTSRQLRGAGEKRLLQQALNLQESFNDNLGSPAFGCANWLIFDYNRGYANDIEASGIMDIFRIPKFSYYFFKSQQDPVFSHNPGRATDPVVFIADHYTNDSDPRIRIFSNCEKITLKINGKEIATQVPDSDQYSSNLKHPPFTFHVEKYEEGTLTAIGYINDKKTVEHTIKTPLKPERIQLHDNCSEIKPLPGKKDLFFVYASVVDKNGTLVPSAEYPVSFIIEGPAEILGNNPVTSEAGISSLLVQSSGERGIIQISAKNKDLEMAVHEVIIE